MGTRALFLTVCCIIAFNRNNPTAEEDSSNIALVRKDNSVWCVAKGEDAFSGLSWVSSQYLSVSEIGFTMSTKEDCKVMRGECKQWTGWDMVDSVKYPMPVVLDYRWNNLPLAKSNGNFTLDQNNRLNISFSNNVWEFTISILGKQDAYIYLCETTTHATCYWIIFGGWNNEHNLIRRCINYVCTNATSLKDMSPLSNEEWSHITVSFHKTTSDLKVYFKNEEILNYQDYRPIDIKYMNVRSRDQPAHFRYHLYSYFRGNRDKPLTSEYYKPNQIRVCWSIVYSIDPSSVNGYLEVKLEYKNNFHQSVIQTLEHTQHHWKHKKVEFILQTIAEVRIVITGKQGDYFAVGGILPCNPNGDSTKSTIPINLSNAYGSNLPDLKCMSLQYPKHKPKLTNPQLIQDCGGDCTLNCNMFDIQSISGCTGTVICKTIGNVQNACFCSSGFWGQDCNKPCNYGFYGVGCKEACGKCITSYNSPQCSPETGKCFGNHCAGNSRLPFCKIIPLYLKYKPRCTGAPTSITVTIDNFEVSGEGTPVEYILQYRLPVDGEWTSAGKFRYNIQRNQTIPNLVPGNKYIIQAVLISGNKIFSGNKAPSRMCGTTCDYPDKKSINIQAFSRSIKAGWQVGGERNPCYRHLYHFILEREGETIYSNDVTNLPFEVQGLQPYKNYTWRILYNGEELYSNRIQTTEDVPSKVELLEFFDVNQTAMTVSWQLPARQNGIIKFYHITYTHKKYVACPGGNQPSSPRYENTTDIVLRLKDLEPYSKYTVSVQAYTVDYGDVAEEEIYTLGYDPLKIQPNFYGKIPNEITKNSATFYWTNPKNCSNIQGYIKGYRVLIQGESDWVKTYRNEFDVDYVPTYNPVTFYDLKPYANYILHVVFKGAKHPSESQYALFTNFRTEPDVPHAVNDTKAYSYGASWIYLRWSEPYPPTGEIEYYMLEIPSSKGKIVGADAKCELWDGMICGKIEAADGLVKDQDYHIGISAKNKNITSPSSTVWVPVKTTEKEPSRPVNVTAVTVSSQKITVLWQHPSETRGKLKNFKLQINLTSSGLKGKQKYEKTETKNVTHDERNYSFELDDLLPASEYYVSVYGETVSEGEKANISVKTYIARPKLGTYLHFVEDSLTNTSFKISLPAADKFLTKHSAYIIIVTSEDEMIDQRAEFKFKNETIKKDVLKEANIENERYSWVAAEVQPESENIFTIGDNKTRTSNGKFVTSAVNVALMEGGTYQVTLVAVNEWKNHNNISSVKLENSMRPGIGPVVPTNVGNVVGWVILVLLLVCIPVVLFFIVKRRKLKKEADQIELRREDGLSGNSQNDIGGGFIIPDMDSEEMPEERVLPPSQRFSCRTAIDDLERYVKSGLASGELQRQHALFPRGLTKPSEYGQLPKNKSKNRYVKLAAYDETRVILEKLPDDPFSDYINANYIDGYKSPKFYIATQGPKRNTVVDFWRMIWQENVHMIAMLANVFEDGKIKCERYWPDLGQEFTQGAVTILNASAKIFADFTFRILNVSSKGKSRKVHHLHFTSWPDHSVPMYPQSVASYLKKLLATSPGPGPIVVHCSAGVGRTGTIILSDICLRMAAAEGSVDMLGYLQKIREQRANLVDSLDQYKLVHLVLLECLVTEPTSYPCDASFEKRVQELTSSGAIRSQFSLLSNIRWQDQALKSASRMQGSSPAQTDPDKNRNLNIVPEPYCQVYISPFPYNDLNSDYINAVYVDGFRVKDQFIVTQFPLESTISDFWRLIAEKKISLIVVLNEIDEGDKNVSSFWPTEMKGSMRPVPHITVTKKHQDDSLSWKTHTVGLTDNGNSRQVHILHLKEWKTNIKMPPSEDVMIGLWEEAERLYKGKGPMVVCCFDGATACGYFVSLAFLIEKIKLEQQCDVCQAVRTVRQNRKHFVPIFEQFESLYKAAETYLDSFQTYSNFN